MGKDFNLLSICIILGLPVMTFFNFFLWFSIGFGGTADPNSSRAVTFCQNDGPMSLLVFCLSMGLFRIIKQPIPRALLFSLLLSMLVSPFMLLYIVSLAK